MENCKVSVLVTFYNQENYVDQTLESVFAQKTDFPFEVIVGDDGSTDATREKVQSWIDRYPDRIRMFVMERGEGKQIGGFRASRNRLNLLKYVRGEYFNFLDGDDRFDDPAKLQTQVDLLEKTENRDCVLCATTIDALYPDGRREPFGNTCPTETKFALSEYWAATYFHTDTMLIRSSVIPALPVKLLENNFNDNLITFSVMLQGRLLYIPCTTAIYAQTGDGIWTGERRTVSLIRNMYMYDIANQLAPELAKQTDARLFGVWKELFKLRKQIDPAALRPYLREAEDKGFVWSRRWILFNGLPQKERWMMCRNLLDIIGRHYYYAVRKRLCRKG